MRWIMLTLAVTLAALGACSEERKQSDPVDTTLNDPEPTPVPKPVTRIALDDALAFSSTSECIAGDVLERIYAKLDTAMEKGADGIRIKLDAFPAGLPVTAKSTTDAEGAYAANAGVRFPEGAMWNGLKLSRITANRYVPPETDSSYWKRITFLETPQDVQRALVRAGFDAKLQPDYSELHDQACGGSMAIEAISGGAALSCGWGC